MDNANPKQQLLEKLKSSTNILVTVSANPSVDQLAACLGLTIWLNKLDKHATAVFSGDVPSTLEFLQPEETLEKNTDSLRDFIIALDKSKADKLRYKVEDKVVKIFITPYRTSLSADDLEFSQGDFNVDMVVALGVAKQEDLDTAITAHGRILHDATVTTITTAPDGDLGSINWRDTAASSLSELVVDLGNELDRAQLDGQIATALLTGIVAQTERFSNEKTTPQTMSVSAELMSAGANQQLVASKLDEPAVAAVVQNNQDGSENSGTDADQPAKLPSEPPKNDDGTLEIEHEEGGEPVTEAPAEEAPLLPPTDEASQSAQQTPDEPEISDVTTKEEPLPDAEEPAAESEEPQSGAPTDSSSRSLVTEPPALGGTLTANSRPDDVMLEPGSDPLSLPAVESDQPLLNRDGSSGLQPTADSLQPAPPSWMPSQPWMNQSVPAPEPAEPAASDEPAPPSEPAVPAVDDIAASTPTIPDELPSVEDDETLSEIEKSVDSPHLNEPDLGAARDEVMKAINSVSDTSPPPIEALNAQSIELTPPDAPAAEVTPLPETEPEPAAALNPSQTTASTTFDPVAFGVMNDHEAAPGVSDAQPPAPPAEPSQLDPDLTTPVSQPFTMPLPPALTPPPANPVPPTSTVTDPTAPPPVPPPMMPPFPQ